MEVYKAILAAVLAKEEIHISFPKIHIDVEKIIAIESYKVLQEIKMIIEDDRLDYIECYTRIEKILCFSEGAE